MLDTVRRYGRRGHEPQTGSFRSQSIPASRPPTPDKPESVTALKLLTFIFIKKKLTEYYAVRVKKFHVKHLVKTNFHRRLYLPFINHDYFEH